jgi:hypothetical protein
MLSSVTANECRTRMGLAAKLHQAQQQDAGCNRAADKSAHEMKTPGEPAGPSLGYPAGE